MSKQEHNKLFKCIHQYKDCVDCNCYVDAANKEASSITEIVSTYVGGLYENVNQFKTDIIGQADLIKVNVVSAKAVIGEINVQLDNLNLLLDNINGEADQITLLVTEGAQVLIDNGAKLQTDVAAAIDLMHEEFALCDEKLAKKKKKCAEDLKKCLKHHKSCKSSSSSSSSSSDCGCKDKRKH